MRASICVVLVTACAVDTAITSDELTTSEVWPQLGFGPAHTGANPDEAVLGAGNVGGLRVAWSATTGLRPGGVVVASGRAYVGSENNTLYAFDATTGRRVWRAFAGHDIAGTPGAAYGRVYFVSNDGFLYAVTSSTGVVAWKASVRPYPTAPVDSRRVSPTLYGGIAYVAVGSRLFAFAAGGCGAPTCGPVWYADVPLVLGSWQTPPVIGKGNVYAVGGTPGTSEAIDLYAFSLAGCTASPCAPVWRRTLGSELGGYVLPLGLVYSGGRVYLATNVAMFSVYADSGVPRWHRNGAGTGAPAVTGNIVYVPTADGLFALDEYAGGATLWRSPAAAGAAWPPAVANGIVYTGLGDAGRLTAFATFCASGGASCEPVWGDTVDGTRQQPAVVGGMVLVGNELSATLRALSL